MAMGHNLCLNFGADEHPPPVLMLTRVQGFDSQPYLVSKTPVWSGSGLGLAWPGFELFDSRLPSGDWVRCRRERKA